MASRPYTQAQNRASQKYHRENLESLCVWMKKGSKEKYKDLAARRGVSLTSMITDYLDGELEKENMSEKEKTGE